MANTAKDEKIKKVEECYKKVKNEHLYFCYLTNLQKAQLILDELPQKPIYGFSSIMMYLTGHFKVKQEHEKLVKEAYEQVKLIPIDDPTTTFIAREIIDRLPQKKIYKMNTILQIISGQYK